MVLDIMSTSDSPNDHAPLRQIPRITHTDTDTTSKVESPLATPGSLGSIHQFSAPHANGVNTPLSPAQQTDGDGQDGDSSKPKQKRNKPTLSCEECVERKTKVDYSVLSVLWCFLR